MTLATTTMIGITLDTPDMAFNATSIASVFTDNNIEPQKNDLVVYAKPESSYAIAKYAVTEEGGSWSTDAGAPLGDIINEISKGKKIYVIGTVQEPHTHSGVKQSGKAATCEADGWKDYYYCSGCEKYFAEQTCTTEINVSEWKTGAGKIAKTGNP